MELEVSPRSGLYLLVAIIKEVRLLAFLVSTKLVWPVGNDTGVLPEFMSPYVELIKHSMEHLIRELRKPVESIIPY